MEKSSLKRKAGSPPTVEDVPDFAVPEDAENFEAEVARIFQEDEERDKAAGKEPSTSNTEPEKPASTAPTVYFTHVVEWQKTRRTKQSVTILVMKKKDDEVSYFVMSDQTGVVLSMLSLDECDFKIFEEELIVEVKGKTSNQVLKLTFPDRIELLRLVKTVVLHSTAPRSIIINEGTGDYKIDENSKLQYKRSVYRLKHKGPFPLPGAELRANMSAERVGETGEFHSVAGLGKECRVMFKKGEEVIEVFVIKARKQKPSDSAIPESAARRSASALQPASVSVQFKNDPPVAPEVDGVVATDAAAEQKEVVPLPSPTENAATAEDLITPSPAPRSFQSTTTHVPTSDPSPPTHPIPHPPSPSPEDVRDALHRVVGIELDRIEMRLNAKFEKFQSEINSRLDRQTTLLEQLLAKQSIT